MHKDPDIQTDRQEIGSIAAEDDKSILRKVFLFQGSFGWFGVIGFLKVCYLEPSLIGKNFRG